MGIPEMRDYWDDLQRRVEDGTANKKGRLGTVLGVPEPSPIVPRHLTPSTPDRNPP